MNGNLLAQLAVLVIFAINAALLVALIIMKLVHSQRIRDRDHRRGEYIDLLSQQLASEGSRTPIPASTAEDPAFLDVLIDMRNSVVGAEADMILDITGYHRMLERQKLLLETRFPLGRRFQAAVALAEIGDESAARILMRYLDDRHPEVRIQCARGLGRMQWTPAIDAIVERFDLETPWVRGRFADTLIAFGTKATWPLLAYVRVNHRFETAGPALAIRALATIGDEETVVPLIGVLAEDADTEIAIATVETLGLLGNPLAIPAIAEISGSDDWRLRAKAVSALGDLKAESTVTLLTARIGDRNWWVRRNAAAALADVPGGDEQLFAALDGGDPFAADAAAEALTDAGYLAAARERHDYARPTNADRALLDYMADATVVIG